MADVLPDAMSEVLDYQNIKRRAVASRNYRTKINPTNSADMTISSVGSQLEFMLPSNLAGSYLDFSQMYLKFKLTPSTGANLDKCGAYGIINRVEVYSSGSQIATINNYNVLATTMVDTDSTVGYRGGYGKILAGLNANGTNGEIMIVTGRTFCLPMILIPFAMQKKLVPLFSLDSIRIRITFETPSIAFVGASNVSSYVVSGAQLVAQICELSPSAQAQIDAMTGGVYRLLCPNYTNVQTSMTASSSTVTATLGVSVSSLERILVVHRIANTAIGYQTLGARITNGLTSFQFSIDSQLYPQAPVLIGDAGAEPLAEMLISSHALSDFQNDAFINSQVYTSSLTFNATAQTVMVNQYDALYSYLNIEATNTSRNCWFNTSGDGAYYSLANANANTFSTAGSFVASLELETSVSAGKSDRLYSGISTIGSVVQYIGNYSGSQACTIDFFCQSTILCTLDMKRLGVWTVSV